MTTGDLTIEDVTARHDAIQAKLKSATETIGEQILRFDRRDTAAIRKAMIAIDDLVRRFHNDFSVMTSAQAKARHAAQANDDDGQGIDSAAWAALMSQINQTRLAVMRWHEIRMIVEAQAEVTRTPLYRDVSGALSIVDVQMNEVSLLVTRLTKLLNGTEQDKATHDAGAFADIPLPHADFLAHMHAAYRLRLAQDPNGPSYFIDVGCGGAMKVFQAARFFDRALGIDLDPGYIKAAERLLDATDQGNARVLLHDALTFPSYGDFHVIYFYRPLRLRQLLTQLEEKIVADAQHGAILIAPYDIFRPVAKQLGLQGLGEAIYVKGYDAEAARALLDRAEQIGPMIRPPLPPLMHVWEPILRSSRRRGWGLKI